MDVWIARDGARHGPYPETEIRDWLRTGQLKPQELAWRDGLADWQPLAILFPDAVSAAPLPAPPSLPGTAAAPDAAATTQALTDYASIWLRFAAWLIDYMILVLPTLIAAYLMGADQLLLQMADVMTQNGGVIEEDTRNQLYAYSAKLRPFVIISTLIGFGYYVLFEASRWQATPGKLATGIRVADLAGRRLNLARCAVRNAVRLVNMITAFVPLAFYLPAMWALRRQGLHDRLAQALVLRGRAR